MPILRDFMVTSALTDDQRSLLRRFFDDPDAVVASRNVAGRLHRIAVEYPVRTAIFEPHGWFGQPRYEADGFFLLVEKIQRHVVGLTELGITPGMRTVLMTPPSHEFVRLMYALLQLGAIPVLVDPGMGTRNLGKCLEEARPEAFIGVPKAQFARWLYGWAKPTLKKFVTIGSRPWFRAGPSSYDVWGKFTPGPVPFYLPQPDDPAAILFTSGSTGVPKGAVYTHGMFCSQVEQLQKLFGIESGEVDLCTFPLFALFAPALGMTSVIPRMDFTRPAMVNPREICEPAIKFHATNLFGSPALLNRVGRTIELGHQQLNKQGDAGVGGADLDRNTKMPTLKRVLSAGAPVSPEILERFAKLLAPGTQIFTPYGATEALPVAVIGSDEVLRETRHKTEQGAGTCVGHPVPDIEVRIIRISDDPIAAWSDDLVLPDGEVGEITVCGPVVTQEYFRRPDLTALAKIPDPVRGRNWHRMGDVGYLDEQGRLWFCGRKSQRVVTSERTYFTEQVEGVFNAHPAVFRSALVGVYHFGRMEPVLCVEKERGAKPQANDEITRELLALGARNEHTSTIATVLYHDGFPVDIRHNSKIFREQLAVWAAEQLRAFAEYVQTAEART